MVLNLLRMVSGILKESLYRDNRYCQPTQNLMRIKGYELIGKEYREIKTKHMINDYITITGHEHIPDGTVLKIREKVCGYSGITSYVVMYITGEYTIEERNIEQRG